MLKVATASSINGTAPNRKYGRNLPHRVAVLSTILGATATLVYAYATYMLFYLAYSLVNIPFGSLASAMTQLPDERARLSSSRTIGAAIAIIGLTVAVAPQISRAADLQHSLTITTLIVAVFGIALYLFLFATSPEAVVRDEAPVSLRQSLCAGAQQGVAAAVPERGVGADGHVRAADAAGLLRP